MATRSDKEEIEVVEMEASNGTTICFETYLKRSGRTFTLNIHLEKWEHPDTIAVYLTAYAELLKAKLAVVNETDILDI